LKLQSVRMNSTFDVPLRAEERGPIEARR